MKNLFLIILFSLCFLKSNGQTASAHETISSLKVAYAAVPQGTTMSNSIPEIKGIPQATIILKNAALISKVYFKIRNKTTNEVVYEINYSINSPVIMSEGKKLFENINGVIFISSGSALLLKPYIYQLQTESDKNILSNVYSSIQ